MTLPSPDATAQSADTSAAAGYTCDPFAMSASTPATVHAVLSAIRELAASKDVFDGVEFDGTALQCRARGAAAEATYSVGHGSNGLAVSLSTPDRWLSESIESDLVHYGDPIEELVEEELVDLGWTEGCGRIRHFRDDAMRYVFTCDLPLSGDTDADTRAGACLLLAFEAAFRQLGDMADDGEEG